MVSFILVSGFLIREGFKGQGLGCMLSPMFIFIRVSLLIKEGQVRAK